MSEGGDAGFEEGFGKTWVSISMLAMILAVGGVMRWHKITRENLWIDEYRTLYLATGRGDWIYRLPKNGVILHPPDVGFEDAPAWWHIWSGISTTTHPPLYLIILRLWVDFFGEGDFSIRGMSALFSLGSVVLLYVAVRKIGGDGEQALIAAALMAFAPIEIYYSQQARPYTMLQFLALGTGIVLISIEKGGWTWAKAAGLALGIMAMALTHYFCVGVVGGLGVYCVIRLRGRARMVALRAMVLAGVIVAAAWGRHALDTPVGEYGKIANRSLMHLILSVPQRLTMESNHDPLAMADNGGWALVISMATIAYLFPLITMRRRKYLLFWWLWVAGGVGLVLGIDLIRHSTLLTISRYVIPAAPGVYALLAAPLPGRIGRVSPWIILIGVICYAVDYWQTGPPVAKDSAMFSKLVGREVSSGDVVIVAANYYYPGDEGPEMTYFVIAHYAGPWRVPVVFGTGRISEEVQRQLLKYRRIWVVGVWPVSDTGRVLPGWEMHDIRGPGNSSLLWYVTPSKAGKS